VGLFELPSNVTNACCEHRTNPEMVAVPVVGSIEPNWVTVGTTDNGGGARSRLNTRFAEGTLKKEEISKKYVVPATASKRTRD